MMTDYADLATRYLVLIEGGPPSNYSAWAPDLPGCVVPGPNGEPRLSALAGVAGNGDTGS